MPDRPAPGLPATPASPAPGPDTTRVPAGVLPAQPQRERTVPDPPLLVRGGGMITTVHVWARLRGNGALAFDLGTTTLAITGRLRVFPLEPIRLLIVLAAAFVGLVLGGALLGPWLGSWMRSLLGGSQAHPVIPAIATALGALLGMLPALVAGFLVMSVDADRLDLPVLALRSARNDADRLVITPVQGSGHAFHCLPNQSRQADELVDALIRATDAVRAASSDA